jgi:hypothetical protein
MAFWPERGVSPFTGLRFGNDAAFTFEKGTKRFAGNARRRGDNDASALFLFGADVFIAAGRLLH